MKITVTHDDGTVQDITELVQIAYDVATNSMDWGSGFLDVEETNGLILLAEACRFPDCEKKIVEVWRDRMAKMPTPEESQRPDGYRLKADRLQQMAQERGFDYWHQTKPTDEEKAAFLAEARGGNR